MAAKKFESPYDEITVEYHVMCYEVNHDFHQEPNLAEKSAPHLKS